MYLISKIDIDNLIRFPKFETIFVFYCHVLPGAIS